jgi:hypothetical protein
VRARYAAEAAARRIPLFTRLEDAATSVAAVSGWLAHRDRLTASADHVPR